LPWTVLAHGGLLVLFLAAGWAWPRRQQARISSDTWVNVINGAVLFAAQLFTLKPLAAAVHVNLLDLDLLGPLWLQAVVAFVALDLTRYWLHRMHHRVPWFWTFHRVHHSSETLDATAGLRMHAVDFVQLWALPVLWFGVLLDTSGWPPTLLPVLLLIPVAFDGFQHANLRVNPDATWLRIWNKLLNHPHFHAWHHTDEVPLVDGNYSNTLIIWDRLFGTEVTRKTLPDGFGIEVSQQLQIGVVELQLLKRRS
jgi:sterol desaturase/sphingolipid hydroxylase (fatty acid hydroxylase superfamily)